MNISHHILLKPNGLSCCGRVFCSFILSLDSLLGKFYWKHPRQSSFIHENAENFLKFSQVNEQTVNNEDFLQKSQIKLSVIMAQALKGLLLCNDAELLVMTVTLKQDWGQSAGVFPTN